MKNDHLVGVLLNYLDASRSIACIQSLLDEQVPHVLVWDNSADGGVSAADIRAAYLHDSRVSIEVCQDNLGFAAGVNAALRICRERFRPDYALVINNDATLRVGAIDALLVASKEYPRAVMISMDIDHAGRRQGAMYYQRWIGLQFARPVPGSFPYASGCCLWVDVTRTTLPLFDKDFFMYGEDCELSWRLLHQHGAWVHLPQLLVNHEGSASSGLGSDFYETQLVAAHLLLARKLSRHGAQAAVFTLARLPFLVARATMRGLRYRSVLPLQALWKGWCVAWRAKRN